PRSILMDRDQSRNSLPLSEDFADTMAGSLGSDHAYIDILRRGDEPEVDIEAVREHQRLARGEIRLDVFLIKLALDMIRDQHHDDLGGLGGIRHREDFESRSFGLRFALAALRQSDNRIES